MPAIVVFPEPGRVREVWTTCSTEFQRAAAKGTNRLFAGAEERGSGHPFQNRKRGVETKIVLADASTGRDDTLIRNIARAHVWFEAVMAGQTFDQIAEPAGTSKRRVQDMIGLAFLAPDIVRDVLDGKQPIGFTSDWCKSHDLPSDWSEQRASRDALIILYPIWYRENAARRLWPVLRPFRSPVPVCAIVTERQTAETTALSAPHLETA